MATSVASISLNGAGVPRARCEPIERRRRPTGPAGSRFCARAWMCRPAARPSIATSAGSPSAATWPTDRMPRLCSFAAVTRPTPHSRSTGSGCRNELAVGRHDQEPVRLRHAARDLREELRPRDADGDRKTDLVEHAPPQPHGDLAREARDPLQPAHVEERLVDREPFDERRRVLEHGKDRLARIRVGRHARRHDGRLRAQPPRLCATHRSADAVRLRLVARGGDHACADDHGAPRSRSSSRCSTDA